MSGPEIPYLKSNQRDADSSLARVETIRANGCSITLRRVDGPKARELFISCSPSAKLTEADQQAEALYQTIQSILTAEGGSFASIVCETLFHRNLRANLELVREVRHRVIAAAAQNVIPALTEIEQPPLNDHSWLEISIEAVLPNETPTTFEAVKPGSTCQCTECVRAQGILVNIEEETRLYSGALYGDGAAVYQQTRAMFVCAEEMLQRAGMEFSDVVRTWIYLQDIDRDYADLNRARREFFEEREIDPPPASTGIGAGLAVDQHLVCLRVYAVKGQHALCKTLMTTPTLNEAPSYGADFSRGMRIAESNREILHISGTASLDETGRTVGAGDFEAQVNRMLVNVAALLEAQGADFGDVVAAITYVKNTSDAQRIEEIFRTAGYEGFAHSLVNAPVCRPELLCETEAIAILQN